MQKERPTCPQGACRVQLKVGRLLIWKGAGLSLQVFGNPGWVPEHVAQTYEHLTDGA